MEKITASDRHHLKNLINLEKLGRCHRRKVGAILTDDFGGEISVGWNGPVERDKTNCLKNKCNPEEVHVSGKNLDSCRAVHAEQAALMTVAIDRVYKCYVSCSPCMTCAKLLALCPNLKAIYFFEEYPQPEAKEYILSLGIKWIQCSKESLF